MAFRAGEKVYIIQNNSRITPVRIIRKDGEFYILEFLDYGRISLRESRLYRTEEEAGNKMRRTPFLERGVKQNGYRLPYQYDNGRSPYGI